MTLRHLTGRYPLEHSNGRLPMLRAKLSNWNKQQAIQTEYTFSSEEGYLDPGPNRFVLRKWTFLFSSESHCDEICNFILIFIEKELLTTCKFSYYKVTVCKFSILRAQFTIIYLQKKREIKFVQLNKERLKGF